MMFDLERFAIAQEDLFDVALGELEAGRKRSHWMWFIFPQMRGLGQSPMAQHFGIGSMDEARAYLADPVLGNRLERCTSAVLGHSGTSLRDMFGSPDDVKFRSSMTLFALASDDAKSPYRRALDYFCDGVLDERTIALLGPAGRA